jgi:hypothetical protein
MITISKSTNNGELRKITDRTTDAQELIKPSPKPCLLPRDKSAGIIKAEISSATRDLQATQPILYYFIKRKHIVLLGTPS